MDSESLATVHGYYALKHTALMSLESAREAIKAERTEVGNLPDKEITLVEMARKAYGIEKSRGLGDCANEVEVTQGSELRNRRVGLGGDVRAKHLLLLQKMHSESKLEEYIADLVEREAWLELDMLLKICTGLDGLLVNKLLAYLRKVGIEGIEGKLKVLEDKQDWHAMRALIAIYHVIDRWKEDSWMGRFESREHKRVKQKIEELREKAPKSVPEDFCVQYPVNKTFKILVLEGKAKLVRAFLEGGVNVEAQYGLTVHCAMDWALNKGHHHVLKAFLMYGADPNGRRMGGCMPLFAVNCDKTTEGMKFLLEYGADPNGRDDDGFTPLFRFCSDNRTREIGLLLGRGADVNASNFQGDTPLHRVAFGGQVKAMKVLLDGGASVHIRNADGETALHKAVRSLYAEAAEVLLCAGADPYVENKRGESVFKIAQDFNLYSTSGTWGVLSLLEEWSELIEIRKFFELLEM